MASKKDLTICSNCKDFLACANCREEILKSEEVCIHRRVEEVYMDKYKQMEQIKGIRRGIMLVDREKANGDAI